MVTILLTGKRNFRQVEDEHEYLQGVNTPRFYPGLEARHVYGKFKYERVALSLINLDEANPRIIAQEKITSEEAIIEYFFEHEDLTAFLKLIATEGRNPGAERPYVIRKDKEFVVIEGNTRIATYKLLTGQRKPPQDYENTVPSISDAMRDELLSVEVAIAPSRESLMIIMARSHFGRGDKNRWRYLGSRKAVYDDWKSGKGVPFLANVFDRSQSQIRDYLTEYLLYLEALKLEWTEAEQSLLLRPNLEFNPPVRFLQSTGHKQLVGIELDKANLKILFADEYARLKFRHLIKRMLFEEGGPNAIASYGEVFGDYNKSESGSNEDTRGSEKTDEKETNPNGKSKAKDAQTDSKKSEGNSVKANALFNYPLTKNDMTLKQLMKEAKGLNCKSFPGAGTSLLRALIEVLLKIIILEKGLNPQGKLHDIESAINLVIGQGRLSADDTGILKEFRGTHVKYINLSAHATLVPNYDRLAMARDCIDAFVKRNV